MSDDLTVRCTFMVGDRTFPSDDAAEAHAERIRFARSFIGRHLPKASPRTAELRTEMITAALEEFVDWEGEAVAGAEDGA